jgi:hypothetical protein
VDPNGLPFFQDSRGFPFDAYAVFGQLAGGIAYVSFSNSLGLGTTPFGLAGIENFISDNVHHLNKWTLLGTVLFRSMDVTFGSKKSEVWTTSIAMLITIAYAFNIGVATQLFIPLAGIVVAKTFLDKWPLTSFLATGLDKLVGFMDKFVSIAALIYIPSNIIYAVGSSLNPIIPSFMAAPLVLSGLGLAIWYANKIIDSFGHKDQSSVLFGDGYIMGQLKMNRTDIKLYAQQFLEYCPIDQIVRLLSHSFAGHTKLRSPGYTIIGVLGMASTTLLTFGAASALSVAGLPGVIIGFTAGLLASSRIMVASMVLATDRKHAGEKIAAENLAKRTVELALSFRQLQVNRYKVKAEHANAFIKEIDLTANNINILAVASPAQLPKNITEPGLNQYLKKYLTNLYRFTTYIEQYDRLYEKAKDDQTRTNMKASVKALVGRLKNDTKQLETIIADFQKQEQTRFEGLDERQKTEINESKQLARDLQVLKEEITRFARDDKYGLINKIGIEVEHKKLSFVSRDF